MAAALLVLKKHLEGRDMGWFEVGIIWAITVITLLLLGAFFSIKFAEMLQEHRMATKLHQRQMLADFAEYVEGRNETLESIERAREAWLANMGEARYEKEVLDELRDSLRMMRSYFTGEDNYGPQSEFGWHYPPDNIEWLRDLVKRTKGDDHLDRDG